MSKPKEKIVRLEEVALKADEVRINATDDLRRAAIFADLDERFAEEEPLSALLREVAKFAAVTLPECRERGHGFDKLEEALAWFHRAERRHGA